VKNIFSFLILFLSLNLTGISQTFKRAELDSFIVKAVELSKAPGFAIGIIKDGEVIFKKGYGTINTETGDPMTTSSLFGIASCSKAFTAAAIGLLVEGGKLDWQDKVIDYLPYFRLDDPYVTSEMRIEDLLCHRSGLDTFDGDLLWYGTDYSREEILRRIAKLPLKNSFRMKYGYSNLMFIAAGEVIKSVTGKTWDEFIKERFFIPLGMNSSTTTNRGFEKRNDIALPHIEGNVQQFINYDNAGPAASINSNIDDLLKWAGMWLNNGKVGDQQILSESLIKTLITPHMVLGPPKSMKPFGNHLNAYGLGWFLSDYNGRLIVRHDGGLPGYLSRVMLVPEENLGVVLLTNDMDWINNPVAYHVLDMMTGKTPDRSLEEYAQLYNSYFAGRDKQKEKRLASRIPDKKPSLALSEYTGKYNDVMYGSVKITESEKGLFFEMEPTKEFFCGEMEHWHYNTFKVQFKDPYLPFALITFEMNEAGKVSGFKIDLPNPDFHFYNLNFVKE
jgi:CubicO group peptidase (beta-lactamase class C family)